MVFQPGAKNPRWNGGISEYPNHAEMKKSRLEALRRAESRCEICRCRAREIHHIDGSRDNHALENLIVLCVKCHRSVDGGRRRKPRSIYKKLYGLNLAEMARRLDCSESYVSQQLRFQDTRRAMLKKLNLVDKKKGVLRAKAKRRTHQ